VEGREWLRGSKGEEWDCYEMGLGSEWWRKLGSRRKEDGLVKLVGGSRGKFGRQQSGGKRGSRIGMGDKG